MGVGCAEPIESVRDEMDVSGDNVEGAMLCPALEFAESGMLRWLHVLEVLDSRSQELFRRYRLPSALTSGPTLAQCRQMVLIGQSTRQCNESRNQVGIEHLVVLSESTSFVDLDESVEKDEVHDVVKNIFKQYSRIVTINQNSTGQPY